MNITDQNRYWRKWDNFQKQRERMFTPAINKAIQEQYKQFLQYYKDGFSPVLATMNISSTPLLSVLQKLYVNVGLSWANQTRLDLIVKERRPLGFNEEMTALILQYFQTNMLNDVENMTVTTKKEILEAIESAINNGFGFDDIVKLLSDVQLTAIRARLIARTEIVTAANQASQIQAIKSGLKLDKIWISARDNRTRMHHLEVNGKQIPLMDNFTVGGFPMQQPGDRGQLGSRTPAKEICNCRCTIAYLKKK